MAMMTERALSVLMRSPRPRVSLLCTLMRERANVPPRSSKTRETVVEVGENSFMEMETVQIKGVDSTRRSTRAKLADGARLVVTEKLMTHGAQTAETSFHVDLDGKDSSANIISRSVARDDSRQLFLSKIKGNSRCKGHSECDGIIMDRAVISAVPEITAADLDAELIHEAAIGKIAGEQLTKLMTLGLTEQEAEEQIINGFLK